MSIQHFLEDRDIFFKTHGKNVSAGWLGISCLWCQDHGTHLGVNMVSGSFSCFRCGKKGNSITLISEIDKCSKGQAYRIARKYVNLDPTINDRQKDESHVESIQTNSLSQEIPLIATRYLEERNFDAKHLIKKYHLYYGGLVGDFKFRIVAPIYFKNEIVSLIGRDITNKAELRYKTLAIEKSKLPAKSVLYNFDTVERDVVIVEGVFDCWRIGDACAASLGTKVTPNQIALLRGLRNVFVLFDSDAKEQAEKLAMSISGLVKHVEVITLNEGDPAEMKDQDVKHLRKELHL